MQQSLFLGTGLALLLRHPLQRVAGTLVHYAKAGRSLYWRT